jgi:hypothetical protein
MEFTKIEVALIEATISETSDGQLQELNDLQLALIGGGSGEVTPY